MGILIKNGIAVLTNAAEKLDILLEGARIVKIAPEIPDDGKHEVIDAEGLSVFPGFVDMHCHLRDPGQEHKEDIESGTKAALRGGFTSVACMPNTNPPIDNKALTKYVSDRGIEAGNSKVYVIGAITKGQKGESLAEMGSMADAGAVAFSDDGYPVADGNMMRLALEYAKTFKTLIISHSEDASISCGGVVNEGLNSSIAGLKGISRAAEEAGIARDIILAEALKTRIHIAHVSTKGSVELIRNAKSRGVKVTCETCPHYFSATDDEILSYNTNAKINPPLREDYDVEAIIAGIADGTIDVIATDHAPHHADEKAAEFDLAPFGTSGFETAFALSYTNLVQSGYIDLSDLARLMSYNPSKILSIGGGELKEGERADITICDLEKSFTVNAQKFVSKGKNSLFDGWKLKGVIKHVIIDGEEKEIKAYD